MDNEEIGKILMPYYYNEFNKVKVSSDINFVYYTNLRTIHSILANKEVWLRNVSCMNDFQEVHQGYELVRNYLFANNGNNFHRLVTILNKINSAFKWTQAISDLVLQSEPYFFYNTYIACLSEHKDSDDKYGKLSMWRAYGRGNGAAIVINKNKILEGSINISGVLLSRVAYLDEQGFKNEFDNVLKNIEENVSKLKLEDSDKIFQYVQGAILAAVLSIKHPGFVEEREWRIIYVDNQNNKDKHLSKEIECINNIPQYIYKIKVDDILESLVKKVIIGPTQYSGVAHAVLENDLRNILGKNYSPNCLVTSNIPIRPECI